MLFKKLEVLGPIAVLLIVSCSQAVGMENFKFHLGSEPKSLDPAQVSLSDSVGYFYQNIYQGLYLYQQKKLVPLGSKTCQLHKLTLTCELNPLFKWSDGKVVQASEYVTAFRHLISYKSKNPIIRILKNLKNASRVFAGELTEANLGVKALGPLRLQFEFDKADPEFLYKLTSPLTAPIRSDQFPKEEDASKLLVTGPYQIETWTKRKRILLTENPNYIFFKKNKPKVEIFFVDDDQTALLLYESHTLNFLKTLPTALISEYKGHSDFMQIPMARFDYIGFSEDMRSQPGLTEALALSLDYEELRKMFFALGVPGCSSLPDNYMSESVCIKYDLEKAKKIFAGLPKNVREKRYHLAFSNYDRDDVSRGMQWMAEQWKTHLGLQVELDKLESGVFTAKLKDSTPDIFRKSVIVDRPTCLSAIENFSDHGSEAFLKIKSEKIEHVISQMSSPQTKKKQQKLCSEALHELIDNFLLIGLGKIHFTILISPQFKNWELNELNGLDLSRLEFDKPKSQ